MVMSECYRCTDFFSEEDEAVCIVCFNSVKKRVEELEKERLFFQELAPDFSPEEKSPNSLTAK